MTDQERIFITQEKLKFEELLKKLGWSMDCLLEEKKQFLQCPFDHNHHFPVGSNHVQKCKELKEGFPPNYREDLKKYEQENRFLNQPGISLTPERVNQIIGRILPITTNLPLTPDQLTVFCKPNERLLIADAIHQQAIDLQLIPAVPSPFVENQSSINQTISQISTKTKYPIEYRNLKRRPIKNMTSTRRKSLYDVAREMIQSGMELLNTASASGSTRSNEHGKELSTDRQINKRRSSRSPSPKEKKKKKKSEHAHHRKHRSRHHKNATSDNSSKHHRKSKRKRND